MELDEYYVECEGYALYVEVTVHLIIKSKFQWYFNSEIDSFIILWR